MPRIAIIGNGERAARHQAACEQVKGIEVAAIAGPSENYQELFTRADIDAVDICAPRGPATRIAEAAMRAGKRVIVEYLPDPSLTAVSRETGTPLTVLQPERHQPLPRDIKATLAAGKLGSLRYAHSASIWHWPAEDQAARQAWGVPSPAENAGAFLVEQATGALDVIAWFFDGVPVTKVFARDCSLGENGSSSWYVNVVLSFADASQAICEVGLTSSFAANTGLQRLALTGMRGSAYFNDRDHDLIVGPNGVRALTDDPVDGLRAAFAELVASGSDTSEDGTGAALLAQAAAESLRTGQPVEMRH